MSVLAPRLAGPPGGWHPAVRERRLREAIAYGLVGLLTLAGALAIALSVAKPNPVLAVAAAVGALGLVALAVNPRYEVSLALIALYLGLLDGPVKLLSASQLASAIRDILILAVVLGMAVRALVARERVRLPPLSGWVLAFVAVVLVEAANPATHGILKAVGGFRQQLEWVPFFFFGYLVMRSKDRFRKLFLLLGVIALANGVVGAYQSHLTPAQLASWGPGYGERVSGGGGVSGRTYSYEGVGHPRPPALGSDSGFGGGVGVLALPGLVALLAVGRRRGRWLVLLCAAGALLGIATAASRTAIVIAIVTLLSYALLLLVARLRATRPLMVLGAIVLLALPVGAVLLASDGRAVFSRQESLVESSQTRGPGDDSKEAELAQIPRDVAAAPLGVGLATYGSAAGFGGHERVTIEGRGATGEEAYNLVALELGLPGLLLWVGLTLNVLALVVRRLRLVGDPELRTYLVAVFAAFLAFTIQGLSGPTLAVTPAGVYLWFAAGIAAYWLTGAVRGLRCARA
ncbi:MAG TPA: hypothetical protein VMU32_07790 [Solirubrobacteraceae bacterium]|nr:hypothetical protein [Solirubrobacteraceae bacterium]